MTSKCIIDSKLTVNFKLIDSSGIKMADDSELARVYTYHCDRRSVICVSPIYLGDKWWIRELTLNCKFKC